LCFKKFLATIIRKNQNFTSV